MTLLKDLDRSEKYAVLFDYNFNTPSRFCPVEYESMHQQFCKQLKSQFVEVARGLYVSKDNSTSMIDTMIEFRSMIKRYPMFFTKTVTISNAMLINYNNEYDLTVLLNEGHHT